jgi:hypothetical protein
MLAYLENKIVRRRDVGFEFWKNKFERVGLILTTEIYCHVNSLDAVIPNFGITPDSTKHSVTHTIPKVPTKKELINTITKAIVTDKPISDTKVQDYLKAILSIGRKYFPETKDIVNREVRFALMSEVDVESTKDLMGLILYRITGTPLVITSHENMSILKEESDLENYVSISNLNAKVLAVDVLRYKKLFLCAFKNRGKRFSKFANKVTRLAKMYHKPIGTPVVKTLTSVPMRKLQFLSILSKLKTEDLVRLYNAFSIRSVSKIGDALEVKIRNGKTKQIKFSKVENMQYFNYIAKELKKRNTYDDKDKRKKTIVNEAVVLSDKQTIGGVPNGSYIEIPKKEGYSIIIGIRWKNVDHHKVDLDLSIVSETGKTGWDQSINETGVYFSGDILDAPEYVTEHIVLYGDNRPECLTAYTSNYDGPHDTRAPYMFFIGYTKSFEFDDNVELLYTLNLDVKYLTSDRLGYIIDNKFYFDQKTINKLTVPNDTLSDDDISLMRRKNISRLMLNDIL